MTALASGVGRRLLVLAVVVVSLASFGAATARAATTDVVVADLYAEPDLRLEAGAVTLLLRTMLSSDGGDWRALARAVPGDTGLWADPARAAALCKALGAGHLVTGSVQGDGVRLVVTVRVTDARGVGRVVISARGLRSDPSALARELAVRLAAATGRPPATIVAASVGELRPFVRAAEALRRGDRGAATAALLGADAVVAARVTGAGAVARALVDDDDHVPDARLAAATQTAPPAATLALAERAALKASPAMRSATRARALVALGRLKDASDELGAAAGGDPVLRLARAEWAHESGDFAVRDTELGAALDARYLPALRFVAGLPAGTLPAALEAKALDAAEQVAPRDPALAAQLGFRAATTAQAPARALALVQIALLPEARVSDAVQLVAGLPESGVKHRLLAELHAHTGVLDAALRECTRAVALLPDDLLTLTLYARLLGASGLHGEAVKAFGLAAAKDPSLSREHARAMLLAGDEVGGLTLLRALGSDATSAESARAVARRLLAEGKARAALAILEPAAAHSGADADLARTLAEAYSLTGDERGAARAQELVTTLGRGDLLTVKAAPLDLAAAAKAAKAAKAAALKTGRPDATGLALDDGAAPGGDVTPGSSKRLALLEPAADELHALLGGFDTLTEREPGLRVALAPLAGSHEGFWWPWQTDPRRLREALEVALVRPPWSAQLIVGGSDALVAEPLAKPALVQLADSGHADLVLLYGLRAGSGGKADVRLVLFDPTTGEAHVMNEALARAQAVGLTGWNRRFWTIVLGLVAVLLAAGALAWFRGTGTVQVRLKLDPAVSEDTYCLRVSKAARPPAIDDAVAWTKSTRQGGLKEGKRDVALARSSTTLQGVPAGRWRVHLWGTHQKGGELRVLPELIREVRIGRGKIAYVEVDLVPDGAEYRIAVLDGAGPAKGAKVWIDDLADKAQAVDASGRVLVIVPKGSHVLRVSCDDVRIVKNLEVMSTKVVDLSFNLERERRLRANAGGIELAGPDDSTNLGPLVNAAGLELGAEPAAPVRPPAEPAGKAGGIAAGTGTIESRAAVGVAETRALGGGAVAARRAEGSAPVGPPGLTGILPAGLVVTPPLPTSPTGRRRYQPQAELGRGAMGVVFRARDAVLERDVALKIISDEVKAIPQVLELFMQEARALAALNHPNVVAVYDQGFDEDGHAFMVMEFVEGRTLESMLEQAGGVLPLDEALPLCDQLLAGVAFAHGRRVIHRDIKPANIFVSNEGTVKLGDFGLARVVRELRIHRTEIRGTPLYMAPEQIHGTDIDHRADLYAVGCTIFEILTGRPPFIDGDVMYHHVHTAPPRPSDLNHDLPKELDAIVLACLEKDKEARVPTADDLRRRLKPIKARYT